jgi:outer membrane protein
VQQTVENLTADYLNAVQKRQQLKFINNLIGIIENQKKIADAKYSAGLASKQDVLYVNIELNNQKAERLKRENEYRVLKRQLITITGNLMDTNFDTDFEPTFMKNFATELNGVENNPGMKMAQTNVTSFLLRKKELNSYFFPKVDAIASYSLARSQAQAGLFLLNQSVGLSYGARVTIPLFNGFVAQQAKKNAIIDYANARLEFDKIKLAVSAEYQQLKDENAVLEGLLQLLESNEKDAEENFFIANQRYEKGVISIIELKEAQRLLETSKYNKLESQNAYFINKVRMMSLAGTLVGGS